MGQNFPPKRENLNVATAKRPRSLMPCRIRRRIGGELAETGRGDVGSWEEYWTGTACSVPGGIRSLYSS